MSQQRPPRDGRRSAPTRGGTGSPLLWLTAGSLLGALAVIAALLILGATGRPTLTPPAGTSPPGASSTLSPMATAPIVTPAVSKPPELASGRSLGFADAPVQLDMWIDYQCPACRDFTRILEPSLVSQYIAPGKARLVIHDFAFIGPESIVGAVAARCADRQGQFWPYHDLLMANQAPENSGALTQDRVVAFAATIGLAVEPFTACLADQAVRDAVVAETTEGSRMPVLETPWLLVNGTNVRPATDYSEISAAIEAALSGATPGTGTPAP